MMILMMCQLYEDGFSSVGKEFNLSPKTVLTHIQHCSIRSYSESKWEYNKKELPKEFSDTMYNLYINQKT